MTTTPRHEPGSPRATRTTNPFQTTPLPIPLDGWNLRASDIFRERPLSDHLGRNTGWLQARPRTSSQIEMALFPSFSLDGMQSDEVRSLLNRALWDAGYTPNCTGANPSWTWAEGN
jgi:hypothetical protein